MEVSITTSFIRLDALLKFAGICESGSDAKDCIRQGCVWVGGEVETRRGKKLYPGEKVVLRLADGEAEIVVLREAGEA